MGEDSNISSGASARCEMAMVDLLNRPHSTNRNRGRRGHRYFYFGCSQKVQQPVRVLQSRSGQATRFGQKRTSERATFRLGTTWPFHQTSAAWQRIAWPKEDRSRSPYRERERNGPSSSTIQVLPRKVTVPGLGFDGVGTEHHDKPTSGRNSSFAAVLNGRHLCCVLIYPYAARFLGCEYRRQRRQTSRQGNRSV